MRDSFGWRWKDPFRLMQMISLNNPCGQAPWSLWSIIKRVTNILRWSFQRSAKDPLRQGSLKYPFECLKSDCDWILKQVFFIESSSLRKCVYCRWTALATKIRSSAPFAPSWIHSSKTGEFDALRPMSSWMIMLSQKANFCYHLNSTTSFWDSQRGLKRLKHSFEYQFCYFGAWCIDISDHRSILLLAMLCILAIKHQRWEIGTLLSCSAGLFIHNLTLRPKKSLEWHQHHLCAASSMGLQKLAGRQRFVILESSGKSFVFYSGACCFDISDHRSILLLTMLCILTIEHQRWEIGTLLSCKAGLFIPNLTLQPKKSL